MRKSGLLLIAGVLFVLTSVQAEAAQSSARRPLLIVRFNQPNVYFERALKQAVTSAEQAKTGVTYEVISYIPADRAADANGKEAANFNLSTVTSFMQQLGVPAERMSAASQVSSNVKSQEVQIFVK
jgi:hypothetical protein